MTYEKPELVVLESASVAIESSNQTGDKDSTLHSDARKPSSTAAYEADE